MSVHVRVCAYAYVSVCECAHVSVCECAHVRGVCESTERRIPSVQ